MQWELSNLNLDCGISFYLHPICFIYFFFQSFICAIFVSPLLFLTCYVDHIISLLPFSSLHYEILISVCHLGMAYELCISIFPSFYTPLSLALSVLHLLTRFPSVLPPSSVNQRRSDKIRPLTLLFVFTLIPHCLLCPVVVFSSHHLSLGYAEWHFMAPYVMWMGPWLVRRLWRKGDKNTCVVIPTSQHLTSPT